MKECIIDDDMILNDDGVKYFNYMNVVDNNYVKTKMKYSVGISKSLECSLNVSRFKVIKPDENKTIDVCDNNNFLYISNSKLFFY